MTLKESHVGFEGIQDIQLQSPTGLLKCGSSAEDVDLTQAGRYNSWSCGKRLKILL